jgi:hypothetical protein
MSETKVREAQKPKRELVEKHLKIFEADDWRVATDEALDRLFEAFPRNCRIEEVYLKVVALDDLYETGIKRRGTAATYDLAKEIRQLNIDSKLARGLPDVVDKIATIKVEGKKCGHVFASKYCHFHARDDYAIYENSFVEPLVYAYQVAWRQGSTHADLEENYSKYKETVESLRDRYKLTGFSFRQLDKFLWGYGREWDAIRPKRKKSKK